MLYKALFDKHNTLTILQVGQREGKMDIGDQHDSGIDVSDHPNSGGSSTRSSPSTENKIAAPKLEKINEKSSPGDGKADSSSPKPQRQQKVGSCNSFI